VQAHCKSKIYDSSATREHIFETNEIRDTEQLNYIWKLACHMVSEAEQIRNAVFT
jgi:hypothetical protein